MSTEILTIKMPMGWVAWVPDMFQSIEFETEQAAIEIAARWMKGKHGDKQNQLIELYANHLHSNVSFMHYVGGTDFFIHAKDDQIAVEISFTDDQYRRYRPSFEGKENVAGKTIEFEQTRVLVYGKRNSSWSYAAMKNDSENIGEQMLYMHYDGKPPSILNSEYQNWHPMMDVMRMYRTEQYAQYYQQLQRIRHDHE